MAKATMTKATKPSVRKIKVETKIEKRMDGIRPAISIIVAMAMLVLVVSPMIAFANVGSITISGITGSGTGPYIANGTWLPQGNQCWESSHGGTFHYQVEVFEDLNGDNTFTAGVDKVLQTVSPAACNGQFTSPVSDSNKDLGGNWPASGQSADQTFDLAVGSHTICAVLIHVNSNGNDIGSTSTCMSHPIVIPPPTTNYTLNVTIASAGTGSGTVTTDVGGVNCSPTCTGTYPSGTAVVLTATAASGSHFVGWSQDCSGTNDTCNLTMDAVKNVTAQFDLDPVTPPTTSSDLAVSKKVDNASPNVGDTLKYTITVTNNGPDAASNISVNDLLPLNVTYVSDDSNGAYVRGTGIWTITSLANGASATLNITVTVNALTAGSNSNTITNTACANLATDPNSANNCASAVSTVQVPVVNPAPSKPVVTAPSCSNVPYTVTITWTGTPDPTNGFYVDVSADNFATYWNKQVSGTTFSTDALTGFAASTSFPPIGKMELDPGTNYQTRVYNGQHSDPAIFMVPTCPTDGGGGSGPATATLTVKKQVINNGGGTKSASDFSLTVNGVTVSQPNPFPGNETGTALTVISFGDYNVTETTTADYTATYSADCNGTIAAGDNKVCTVTNTFKAPIITTGGGGGGGAVLLPPSTGGGGGAVILPPPTPAPQGQVLGVSTNAPAPTPTHGKVLGATLPRTGLPGWMVELILMFSIGLVYSRQLLKVVAR